MLNTAMQTFVNNSKTRPWTSKQTTKQIQTTTPTTTTKMVLESVKVTRDTRGAANFLPIFKILVETKSISLITAIQCLKTCKTMYASRKWFGDRRPVYKMICIEQYQKKKKEKQKAFFVKAKAFRKKQKTQKAVKKYNQLKSGIFEMVLKKLDSSISVEQNRRALVAGKKGNNLKLTLLEFVPGQNKFVRLLARKSIHKKFNVELTEFVSIQYPKLALLSGPGYNNGRNYRTHHLVIGVWVDTNKRPKVRSKRGGKRTKNKDNKPRLGRKKCPSCGGYH